MKEHTNKRNDIILIGAILLVALVVFIGTRWINKAEGAYAVVTIDGEEFGRFSLDTDRVVLLPGRLGNCSLLISDGKAKMLAAPCPDLICVHHKAICYHNEMIVCLPGRVVIRVVGEETANYDALVQ